MAPLLFLFFAEALSAYLSSGKAGIKGLCLPNNSGDLLDSEFVDDTAVYLEGRLENMLKLQRALEIFCTRSGAKLNWNKTVGFWVSESMNPNWKPHAEFRWIQEGSTVRYLGC